MESKDELKEVDRYDMIIYDIFDDTIRDLHIDFDNILLDEKSYKNRYENILIYDISYEIFMVAKPLRIMFDKISGFIKIYDGIKYLISYEYK